LSTSARQRWFGHVIWILSIPKNSKKILRFKNLCFFTYYVHKMKNEWKILLIFLFFSWNIKAPPLVFMVCRGSYCRHKWINDLPIVNFFYSVSSFVSPVLCTIRRRISCSLSHHFFFGISYYLFLVLGFFFHTNINFEFLYFKDYCA